MESTDGSQPRVLARLVAASSTLFALAVGAHLAAGGAAPTGMGLAVLASLTLAWSAVLARWRLRVSTMLPAAAVWQWFMHHALSLVPPSAVVAASGHAGHAGHAGPAMMADPALLVTSVAHGHGASMPMLAAHAVATVATAVLLAATERGAERALERWRWALPALLGVVEPVLRPSSVRPATPLTVRWPRLAWVLGAVGSRAPPLPALPA